MEIPLKQKYITGKQYKNQKSSSSNSGNATRKPGKAAKAKTGVFHHDPKVSRVQRLNSGGHARIFWEGKSHHVKTGSPEFFDKLDLIGDSEAQAAALTAAGFGVRELADFAAMNGENE